MLGVVRVNRPDVIDDDFGGEAVVMHLGTGRYYSFNKPATQVWALMREPRLADEVIATCANHHAVATFLADLVAEGLIITDDAVTASLIDPVDGITELTGTPSFDEFDDMQDLLLLDPVHDVAIEGDGWPIQHKPDATDPS